MPKTDKTGIETLLDLTAEAYRAKVIAAAQGAIDGHTAAMRLEGGNVAEIDLWHLLVSLLEWCDAQTPVIDFDATLSDVREYIATFDSYSKRHDRPARSLDIDGEQALDSPSAANEATRWVEFIGQAWINNHAVECDDARARYGVTEAEWAATGGANAADYDDLAQAARAPQWVKDWSGPFDIKPDETSDEGEG